MKIVAGLFVAIIFILFLPQLIGNAHAAQAESTSQQFNAVTTGGGVTTATLTLSQASFYTDSVQRITVASDNTSDAPSAQSYTSSNRHLVVEGLNASDTRVLTVSYEIVRDSNNGTFNLVAGNLPTFLILAALFVVVVIGVKQLT